MHRHDTPKIGLALGGGGARGLCHIAFLRALDEMGVRPSIISGTSIGAIIAALYAAGMTAERIEALTYSIGFKQITQMLDFSMFSSSGIVKGRGVEEFLSEYLPLHTFEELIIKLRIVATDFWRREEVVFNTGKLIPAIRASISIPGLLEPVNINNRILVDGGVVNPVPISSIYNDCELLIAIDVSGNNTLPGQKSIPSIFDNVMTTFQIMESAITDYEMQIYTPDIYVKPDLSNIQLLDFYKSRHIIKSVDKDVVNFKEALTQLLYQRRQRPTLSSILRRRPLRFIVKDNEMRRQ